MRTKSFLICLLLFIGMTSWGHEKIYNKYSMNLARKEDGTIYLPQQKKFEKLVDLSKLEDVLVPYTHKYVKLKSSQYNKSETKTVVYKTYPTYELKIDIDVAESDTPTPVMFYIHGGGWARGSYKSHGSLCKYLAQQHDITGVRIMYTLAPQENASIEVTIQDILDAVQYIKDHAKEYNIDPKRIGFCGFSAGGHLSGCAALMTNAKVLVGYAGVYDLTTANVIKNATAQERIRYFCNRDPKVLEKASPLKIINKKTRLAAQLFCGTADIAVEYSQSVEFAKALEQRKGCVVDLQVYENYDHVLNSRSDKTEEIFFKTVDFITQNL